MFLNWLLIFEHARKRPGGRREHPLADPLERPEWQGLDWFVRLISRGSRRRRSAKAPAPEKARERADRRYAPA
ncbi:hypothetical protein M8R20_10670 [Pseudomonas sp. R2.Fl]|nr:hypothetical protein [Pseudomonas sp. R2.Fl]